MRGRTAVAAVVCVAAAAVTTACGSGATGSGAAAAPPSAAPSSTAPRPVTADGALSGVTRSGAVAVVLAEEAVAARVTAGQQVRVSFPAVPDLELPGRVAAVAPSAVTVSGVTSYYVTVEVSGGDPRLRAGMTAVVTWG